ncbi:MAG TPA: hypothetical protein VJ960_00175, partial [Oceanipulchritudo sp.]|nr:hypothetical protein [Oceanipulchritudo sp.]
MIPPRIFSIALLIALAAHNLQAKTIYVDEMADSPAAPYGTWGTATNKLQTAISSAVDGDQIWVARGTYYPDEGELQPDNDRAASFQLKSGISIYGGFIGGETDISEADSDKNITTLSGEIQQDSDFSNNSYHVVTVLNTNGGAQPLIQGIGIASGYADGLESLKFNRGGGLYCFNSSPQIRDVWFYDNFAQRGGAVFNESSSSPTFERTILLRNSAQEGGAMYNSSASSPMLENCFILGNQANLGGGALFNFDRSAP